MAHRTPRRPVVAHPETDGLDRRQFLATTAAGLTLAFALPGVRTRTAAAATAFAPNAWLTITPDGIITVHVTRAEMGQGIGTALAQIVAEELEADWKDVRVDYPGYDPKYGPMVTWGSLSVNVSFDALSRAGAAARIMLVDAAARHWKVDPADCVAERGVIRHPPTGRSISYGDLVARAPITKTISPDEQKAIKLKKPHEYRVIGKWIPRLDIPEKVTGRAKYSIDVFLPGMAYAKVAYPPTREGGKHTAVDDSAARRVKGYLHTIVSSDIVAVVAETYEAAVEARDALRVTWDPGPNARVSTASIFREYERKAQQEPGDPWVTVGDTKAGMARAVMTHTATYRTDFAAQAQLEPLNCVARYENGVYDLYTSGHRLNLAAQRLATKLGVQLSRIRIHQHHLGGSFGARLEWDIMLEAALIAREAGRPIKLIRSREEEFERGYPRTPTLQVLRAGLDAAGRIIAWEHTLVSAFWQARWGPFDASRRPEPDIYLLRHVYDMPNQLMRAIQGEHGMAVGAYRSVAAGYTHFAIEAFLDELAHLAKVDPLQMRISMLARHPRFTNVIRLAAARSGWGRQFPPGAGRGFACSRAMRTWTAAVVQVKVDPVSGEVAVEKITCAVDCGIVVNPDGVRAQVEGALLFGLSSALKEYGTVTNGAFDQKNFEDYPVLRMDEVPEVELHVVDSTEPPTGVGEPGTAVVPAALCNAIFAATGARVRRLPFLPERVLEALKEKP
jgi:isoquinoline 1-oxidoreductase beta subunit